MQVQQVGKSSESQWHHVGDILSPRANVEIGGATAGFLYRGSHKRRGSLRRGRVV